MPKTQVICYFHHYYKNKIVKHFFLLKQIMDIKQIPLCHCYAINDLSNFEKYRVLDVPEVSFCYECHFMFW